MGNGRVALIGMPGSGKSAVGQVVARRCGRPFVDVDALIEEEFGPIPRLFEQGEAHFRRCEAEALRRAVTIEGAVIATGGGVVTQPASMEILKRAALVVFLDRPLGSITADIDTASRPLLAGGVDALNGLYRRRLPLYRRYADVTVVNGGAFEDVCDKVLKAMGEDES